MQYKKEHQAPFFTRVKDLFKLSLTALNDFKRRLCWSLASIHALDRFFIKHQKRPAIARPHKIAFLDHHGSKSTLFYACKQLLIARRVRWIGDDQYDLRFNGDDSLYRYWDATEAVTFGLNMAHQALEHGLGEETKFLDRFD